MEEKFMSIVEMLCRVLCTASHMHLLSFSCINVAAVVIEPSDALILYLN